MITAHFYEKPGDGSIRMTIKGHASAAPRGEDLICASATTLVYTAAQAVQFLYHRGKLRKKPRIRIGDGHALIIATPRLAGDPEAAHIFWVVQTGFLVLAHNYPKHVKLQTTI